MGEAGNANGKIMEIDWDSLQYLQVLKREQCNCLNVKKPLNNFHLKLLRLSVQIWEKAAPK